MSTAPTPPTPPTEASPGSAQRQWHEALAQGRFLIQHCGACAQAVHYPREVCPQCGADALQWREAAGSGTVHATTTVRRAAEAGGDLNVALIDLDEGVRLMGRVDGVAPQVVAIGQRVQARIGQAPANLGGQPLLLFTLITPQEAPCA